MLLSIIVISHNQCEQLKRCLDSILAQKIPFEYEMLISDDASSDGSYELAQEYAHKYPVIHAYACDTNTMNPSNNSYRSGLNRCNALQYAKGKYIAHIDGDDFLLPDSLVYQKQVEMLENHPECAACMANDYTLVDGEKLSTMQIRHLESFETGQILKKEDYLRGYFRESHCFVYRRNPLISPIEILRGYYVDNAMTAFYIQFGDIVCLDDAGYVYVQYPKSIWNGYALNDKKIISCAALYNAILMPQWKSVYWQSAFRLTKIKDIVALAMAGEKVSDETNRWMHGIDCYLLHAFNRPLSMGDKIHLYSLWVLLGIMRRTQRKHPSWPQPWRLLDKLL